MIVSNVGVTQETLDEVKKILAEDGDVKKAIQEMNGIRKQYNNYSYIGGAAGFLIPFVIAMIVLGALNSSLIGFGALIGAVAGVVIGILIFFAFRSSGKTKMNTLMRTYVLPLILQGAFKEKTTYYPKGIFNNQYLRKLKLFQCTNIIHNEALEGVCLGVPFSCEDVNTYHMEERGSGNNTHTERVTDFNGTVFRLRYNKPSKSTIYVATKDTGLGLYRISGPKVLMEAPEFMHNYYVVSPDTEETFRVLTPEVQYRFDDMTKITSAAAVYRIQGDLLEITFSGPTRSILNFKGDFGEEDLPGILKSVIFIKALIKTLALDNTYWLDIEKNKNLLHAYEENDPESENKDDAGDVDLADKLDNL